MKDKLSKALPCEFDWGKRKGKGAGIGPARLSVSKVESRGKFLRCKSFLLLLLDAVRAATEIKKS